jgi:transcription antitermination factor NusG
MRPHPRVSIGTRVRVRDGVFADVEGVVTELRHQSKVILELGAIRQCFSLEIELNNLEVMK